jgi:hypothetical protein
LECYSEPWRNSLSATIQFYAIQWDAPHSPSAITSLIIRSSSSTDSRFLAEKVIHGPDPGKSFMRDARNTQAQTKFSEMGMCGWQSDTFDGLEETASWLKLSMVERSDRDYADLLRLILRDIEVLSGLPLLSEITWSGMTIFVSSPGITIPLSHRSRI